MQDEHRLLVKSRNPTDTWAMPERLESRFSGRLAAPEVVFQQTGLRGLRRRSESDFRPKGNSGDLEGDPRFTVLQVTVGPKRPAAQGVPSLAVSQRGQPERRSMRGERGSLGTLSCDSGAVDKNQTERGMLTPVRERSETTHRAPCASL